MKRRSFDQADRIRLKLQWLDEHWPSRFSAAQKPTLIDKTLSTAPLVPLAVGFIVGIILAGRFFVSHHVFPFIFCTIFVSGILLAASFRLSPTKRLCTATISAFLLFICLGVARFEAIGYRGPNHISRLLKDDRCLATIRGRIVSPIAEAPSRRDFSTIPWLSGQQSFYLEAKQVHTADGWRQTSGRVRVQVSDTIKHVKPGDNVQIYCWLSRFSPPANPGQFDLARHMRCKGVYVAAAVSTKDGVEVLHRSQSIIARLRSLFYPFAADSLLDETMTDADVCALSSALLLGRRSNLNPVLVAAFQKTSLSHFISLSGMHVAILAGSLWLLLKRAQLPKRPRAVLCIVLILIYALIVPPRAPTMRAVFLSCFFFGSTLLRRDVNGLNTLALSAVVLLFARPYELFTAGWQLSFLSVLGILVLYNHIHYLLLNTVFFPIVFLFNKRFVSLQHFFYGTIQVLAVGFSAWIVISPILLYYFGQVNPLSPVWTTLTVPLIALILYAGFLKIILAAILPTLSSLLGVLLNLAAVILEKMVVALSHIDCFHLTTHRPNLTLVLALYGLLIAFLLIPYYRDRLKKTCLLLLVAGFCLPFINSRIYHIRNNTLEMTCLSVGHGQAIIVSAPRGQHYLFDAGSITHQNLAQKTICPCLRQQGVFELDAVWLSHGDLDHLNAVPHLAAAVPLSHVYANAALLENAQKPSTEKRFGEALSELSLPMEPITDVTDTNLNIRSLWPNSETAADTTVSENNKSQVFLIEYAGRKVLLCGDIEKNAQQALLKHYPTLTVDVMILPHHGSTNNLEPEFIKRLCPKVAIASCSRRNAPRAWQPPPESSIKAFNTATDGAVTVKIKSDGKLAATGFMNAKSIQD